MTCAGRTSAALYDWPCRYMAVRKDHLGQLSCQRQGLRGRAISGAASRIRSRHGTCALQQCRCVSRGECDRLASSLSTATGPSDRVSAFGNPRTLDTGYRRWGDHGSGEPRPGFKLRSRDIRHHRVREVLQSSASCGAAPAISPTTGQQEGRGITGPKPAAGRRPVMPLECAVKPGGCEKEAQTVGRVDG